MNESSVRKWCIQFKNGRTNVHNEEKKARLSQILCKMDAKIAHRPPLRSVIGGCLNISERLPHTRMITRFKLFKLYSSIVMTHTLQKQIYRQYLTILLRTIWVVYTSIHSNSNTVMDVFCSVYTLFFLHRLFLMNFE
ncbi:hypothetical protein QTP88_007341 [Uroleucon formosanum]